MSNARKTALALCTTRMKGRTAGASMAASEAAIIDRDVQHSRTLARSRVCEAAYEKNLIH
jgi:hypothetical protein